MIKCRLYIRRLVQNSITPLHVAAKWGRKGMVALLLDSGATIDARTRVIESALVVYNTFSFCRFMSSPPDIVGEDIVFSAVHVLRSFVCPDRYCYHDIL